MKTSHKVGVAGLILAGALALTGCGDKDTPAASPSSSGMMSEDSMMTPSPSSSAMMTHDDMMSPSPSASDDMMSDG